MKKSKLMKIVSLVLLGAFILTQGIVFSIAENKTENTDIQNNQTTQVKSEGTTKQATEQTTDIEAGKMSALHAEFNGGISPFAIGDPITVDGVSYTILTEGTVSDKGTVEVGNNATFSTLGDLVIPATIYDEATQITYDVISISANAFNGATGLQGKVSIPSSVTLIGNSAFKQSGITGLDLPSEGEIVIDDSAFETTTALTGKLTIASSVKSIGDSAFKFSGISSVDFQEGKLTTIGDYSFENLSSLGGVINIPANVTTIGDAAFAGTQINSLTFTDPGADLIIEQQAFMATHLAGVIIFPARVVEIKAVAFSSITDVTSFVFLNAASAPILGSDSLFSNSDVLVFYPIAKEADYRAQVIIAGVPNERQIPYGDSTARIIELTINGVRATIDEANKEIRVNLTAANIDATALTPIIGIIGDYVSPDPTTLDFSKFPGEYTVRSRDSLTQVLYKVYVNAPLSIKTQPVSVKAVEGEDVEFAVSAYGASQKFQWQSSTDGVTWNDINGNATAITSNLKISGIDASMNGMQYKCKVYNDVPDQIESSAATLTVGTGAQIISDQESMTIIYGYAATSSEPFTLSGTLPISVTKLEGDDKITWNDSTKTLDVDAGLQPGFYIVTLAADNGFGIAGTLDFYVIVMEDIDANDYPVIDPFIEFTGSGSISVRIDAPFAKFSRVLVDGEELDYNHYTAIEGSTIINLKEEYLKTLPNGKYTLTAIFFDGMTNTEFIISSVKAPEVPSSAEPNLPDAHNATDLIINTKSASTADNNHFWLLSSLLSLTVVSFTITLVLKKKNN